jgi:uncharacterized protein (DUF2236 family)
MLGIREQDLPGDWNGFLAWFDTTIDTSLRDTESARDVLSHLDHVPKPPIPLLPTAVWDRLIRPAAYLARLVTTGTLRPDLRDLLDLRWTPGDQRRLDVCTALVRTAFLVVPPPLRYSPALLMAVVNVRISRRRERRRRRREAARAWTLVAGHAA